MRKALAVFAVSLLMALGLTALSSPAQANAACGSGQICLYPCYLAESCNAWFASSTGSGCIPTGATGLEHLTYSIKNNTNYQYWVYHSTNCTQAQGIAPVYAHSSGNMNAEWAGAGIKSFRKA